MKIIGQKVSHNTLGTGTIVWYGGRPQNNSTYVKVEFDNKTLEFVFPTCFEKHLTALDDDFAKMISETLAEANKTKIQEQTPSSDSHVIKSQIQKHKPISFCSVNTFLFKKETDYNKSKRKFGFLAADKSRRNVGVIFMNDDKRRASYGQAEICFFDDYIEEFGEWRLISINKERVSFKELSKILNERGCYEVTIDPRKGS